jgi:signal transduction histidine kinase
METSQIERKSPEAIKSFHLVKYISLSSLMALLVSTFLLSIFISQRAKAILLKKSEQYAFIVAENLNNRVFFDFTLPTLIVDGEIRLSKEDQFTRLDKVVRNTIQGFGIERVNIYNPYQLLTYSTEPEGIGNIKELGESFQQALGGESVSVLEGEQQGILGFLGFIQGDSARRFKTYLPMRVEKPMTWRTGKVLGVFEITQDMTRDYRAIYRFQWIVMVSFLAFVGVLFTVLLLIAKKAEQIITARAEERRKLEEKLHQAERLAALGEMVAGVSHEIRNPLGIIRSTAELLHFRLEDERKKRLAGIMVEEATRLNDILTEFLDFARPKTPHLSLCRLEDIIDKNLRVIEADCEKRGVRVERDYQAGEYEMEADADLIYRALVNLFSNALQAMPQGGLLHIRTSLVNGVPVSPQVELCIQDTGLGIPPAHQKKVFNPFFTTREKGTGLGLAIVQSIVDVHHGDIELKSREGRGTLVTLRFPLSHEE